MPSLQKTVSNSTLGVRLGLAIGRWLPPRLASPLCWHLSRLIARRERWAIVQGTRLNQWVVRGEALTPAALDQAVQAAFRAQASALYDVFRYLARPAEMAPRLVTPPAFQELFSASQNPLPGKGFLVAGIHLSNFDFALHALTHAGARAMVITLDELPGGYQTQFELRRSSGVEMVTASVSSFRLAIQRLREGGVVATGIDRPIPSAKHHPLFFGHPAPLPTHHITLALKAQVPIRLMAVQGTPDGRYHVHITEPIHLEPDTDREREITRNAEQVLAAAEIFIRQTPEQWAMFLPVWPALSETIPARAGYIDKERGLR